MHPSGHSTTKVWAYQFVYGQSLDLFHYSVFVTSSAVGEKIGKTVSNEEIQMTCTGLTLCWLIWWMSLNISWNIYIKY